MILFSHEQILIFVVKARSFFNIRQKIFKVDDLGWSSTVEEAEGRVVNKDGSFNLIRKGEKYHLYHLLISMTWLQFVLLIFVAFTLINGIFAFLYYFLGTENLSGFVSKGFVLDIINLFHFSVQTITTVGYGAMHPIGIATGVIASVEALIGLMSFALIAGLMYGRFSNPKAELKYAKHMVMTNVDGKPTLQARVANKLSHDLFDIRARILMLHNEKNSEGVMLKRYNTLKLQIDNISFLPMNWTITHFIDKDHKILNSEINASNNLDPKNLEEFKIFTFEESFLHPGYAPAVIEREFYERYKTKMAEFKGDSKDVFLNHTLEVLKNARIAGSLDPTAVLKQIIANDAKKNLTNSPIGQTFESMEELIADVDGKTKIMGYQVVYSFKKIDNGLSTTLRYVYQIDTYYRVTLKSLL